MDALLNLSVLDESNNAYREEGGEGGEGGERGEGGEGGEGGKTIVVQCKPLNVITLEPRETEHNIRINFIRI
jgi:hypothetical protein